MSSPPQSDPTNVFSVRIVSIDYYMAPPIPDLDFCYSAFQGRKVEEVPVIRIYGSTPAGQKACLHVHQALPYLYVPYPDGLLQNPEEGQAYLHVLSGAVEKALSYKSTVSKTQHVHGCSLVRAKKFYGYYSSEELFMKIYLYYPHEVARAAGLLLGGNILNQTFQPYESHIPYLLQFLVDYNLYGMSHVHTSKFKFRPPLPDGFIPKEACYKKLDTLEDSSSRAVGNPAIWLSSTVPSGLVWSDSATGHDDLEDKSIDLIRRQSICGLELDSIVNDILNDKYKSYTPLSQTRSEVKMVQSLIPIWEEYKRSGVQEAVKAPDIGKPFPENVLKSFINGLEYENAFSELFSEEKKYFPSEVSAIEDEKLEYIKSLTDRGEALMEHGRLSSPCGEQLKCPEEEHKNVRLAPVSLSEEKEHATPFEKPCEFYGLAFAGKKTPSSEMVETEDPKSPDNEALGLLSWLASSQAVEDLSTDDELVHEAILSPLLPTKSYKKALEIAHLGYESASQKECQDILDSVCVLKSEGLKEQASCVASHENISVSSDSAIPQLDGSSDDNFRTPQKDGFSCGREKSSVHMVQKCTSKKVCGKYKKKRALLGPLPFSNKYDSEPASLYSSFGIEIRNDSESSSTSHSKDRFCDASGVEAGTEVSGEKLGKLSAYSMRDLMRRKRTFRAEQSECERDVVNLLPEVQEKEMLAYCPKEPSHHSFGRDRPYAEPSEPPHTKSSLIDQDGIVQGSMKFTTVCTEGLCTERYCVGPNDQLLQPNKIPNEHLGIHRGSDYGGCINMSIGSPNFTVTGLSLPQIESIKLSEPLMTGDLGNSICSAFSGCDIDKKLDSSWSYMKSASYEVSGCIEDLSAGYQKRKLNVCENMNNERVKSRFCEDFVDEYRKVNQAFNSNSLATVSDEHAFLPHASESMSKQYGRIVQERVLETHSNRLAETNSALDACNLLSKNHISRELDVGTSSANRECETCSDSQKEENPMEYIEMIFSSKPPSTNVIGTISEDSPWTARCDESLAFGSSILHANRQCTNDILPFFITKSEEGQSSKSSLNEENLNFRHESALGVPCHFQNDGSVLYLLTHASSPPTVDSVHQWLSEVVQHNCPKDTAGSYKDITLLSSSDPTLKHNNGLGAAGHACSETSPESNSAIGLMPELSPSSQENNKILDREKYSSHVDIIYNEPQVAGVHIKENVVANNWQDISQISGPDEKSNLTPLSQIGFRDPASIGGGQKLTLISIEVQAESRGDLRPDPQLDSINIISLAVQEDTSPTFELYVLMRGSNEEPYGRNVSRVFDCKFVIVPEEKHLLVHFVKIISSFDPDILMGWEIQGGSLGFLAERAVHLGIGLLKKISRAPQYETKYGVRDSGNPKSCDVLPEPLMADTVLEDTIIDDEWGRTHASGIHVGGRIVLNVWRLMRAEIKLNMYSIEAVAEEVLKRKIPSIPCRVLNHWFSNGPGRARYRCIEYVMERAKLNIQIMNQLDMINRTSELARVFGIDFFSVLSRGSQFRVESMLLRLAHTQNYLAISPGNQQVASQPAMECIPLVMEPESGFYVDPVVVLDFQSLYPSMIIAYNLCFSTCLGKVVPSKENVLGVSSYSPKPELLKDLKQQILLTPNGVMYVPSKVRKGVLPRLLDEILSTRIMIKQAMKKLKPSQQVLQRIFNARQLALKLIANVTYGYTAAGFSGRMPCAELADSIVQCGRRTLETAISFVNEHDKWKAKVIYGDTDSMFVLLKGRSLEEAFRIGNEIASSITAMNPTPVTLRMEKVYQPCFLLTKKRYVGYSYESPDQDKPTFDAKGIETVRRDTCLAVAKTLEKSIRLIFEHQDISKVKSYLYRQWTRILSGKFSLQDFIFAKEVRLGTYSAGASSLPPSAIVATKTMRLDPRAEPRYGERIPYVVIHGEPGARLMDMVVDPHDLLEINSPYRLNDLYYINKQIIPALQRVFGLLGADLNQWFLEMPRPVRPTLAKRQSNVSHSGSLHESDDKRVGISKKARAISSRIDTYYISKHCTLCGELVQVSDTYLCDKCSKNELVVATVVVGRTSRLEGEIHHLAAICRQCGGGDWIVESGVKCTSLACPVFYERRKVQKELKSLSSFATEAGYYPSCMAEWF